MAQKICILLSELEIEDVLSSQKERSWRYSGGCFKDGQPVLYKLATPDQDYSFDSQKLPVEIIYDRKPETSKDPISDATNLFNVQIIFNQLESQEPTASKAPADEDPSLHFADDQQQKDAEAKHFIFYHILRSFYHLFSLIASLCLAALFFFMLILICAEPTHQDEKVELVKSTVKASGTVKGIPDQNILL